MKIQETSLTGQFYTCNIINEVLYPFGYMVSCIFLFLKRKMKGSLLYTKMNQKHFLRKLYIIYFSFVDWKAILTILTTYSLLLYAYPKEYSPNWSIRTSSNKEKGNILLYRRTPWNPHHRRRFWWIWEINPTPYRKKSPWVKWLFLRS